MNGEKYRWRSGKLGAPWTEGYLIIEVDEAVIDLSPSYVVKQLHDLVEAKEEIRVLKNRIIELKTGGL